MRFIIIVVIIFLVFASLPVNSEDASKNLIVEGDSQNIATENF